jgi:hypothetical protein
MGRKAERCLHGSKNVVGKFGCLYKAMGQTFFPTFGNLINLVLVLLWKFRNFFKKPGILDFEIVAGNSAFHFFSLIFTTRRFCRARYPDLRITASRERILYSRDGSSRARVVGQLRAPVAAGPVWRVIIVDPVQDGRRCRAVGMRAPIGQQ